MNVPTLRNPLAQVGIALRAAAQWRLLTIWVLALLLPTAIATLPLAQLLGSHFNYAVHAPQWAQQFNGIALAELLGLINGNSSTLISTSMLLGAALSVLLSPWLTGTVLVAARARQPLGFAALIQGGLHEYGPLLRLLLWGLIPLGAALVAAAGLFDVANDHADRAILESSADLGNRLALLGGALALLLAHLSLEIARAWLAVEPWRRSALRAWWRGLGVLRRRPLRVLTIYLTIVLTTVILAALLALARVHTPALGGVGIVAAFALTQLLVAVFAWGRAARVLGLSALVRAHRDARDG